MKKILTLLFVFTSLALSAQVKVLPGDKTIETKWIDTDRYEMIWSVISRDSTRYEAAIITTQIVKSAKKLTITANIEVTKATTKWIDTTIVAMPSLSPIHHSSDNLERSVSLNFGKTVTGKYNDKIKLGKNDIKDVVEGQYFDSNFYPYLIRLLPYKEDYTAKIPIYDYSPAKKGVIDALITGVKSGTYKNKKGSYPVWIVTSVETVKGQATTVKYFIGKADRIIWKQEIFDGMLNTLIERKE